MTILGCFGGITVLGNTHIKRVSSLAKVVNIEFSRAFIAKAFSGFLSEIVDTIVGRFNFASRTFLGQEIHDKFLQAHIVSRTFREPEKGLEISHSSQEGPNSMF